MKERRFTLLLLLIHAVYFIVAVRFRGIYLKDSAEYLLQASNLLKYGIWYAGDFSLPIQPALYSFRPPLYGGFILLCKLLNSSDLFLLLVQNIMSISNILFVQRFLSTNGVSFRWRNSLVMLMLLLFPTQTIMANMVMSEMLFQTLALHLFLQLWRFALTHSMRSVWLIAVFSTAMVLTKPVFMAGIIPVFLWVVMLGFRHEHQTRKRLRLLMPLVLFPLAMSLVAYVHQRQTGLFHYTSMTAVNQFKYNARYTMIRTEGEQVAEQFTDSMTSIWNQWPFPARDHAMMRAADSIILSDPAAFTINYARGCAVFMLDPGRHDIARFLNLQSDGFEGFMYKVGRDGIQVLSLLLTPELRIQLILIVLPFVGNLAILWLLFMFLFQQHNNMLKWLLLGTIIYFVAATGMLGVARYKTVIFPQLMMVVSFAIDRWYKDRALR